MSFFARTKSNSQLLPNQGPRLQGANDEVRARREARHLDELLDEALSQTFPASDPPAIQCTRQAPRSADAPSAIALSKEIPGSLEWVADQLVELLHEEGFAVCTRIDLRWPPTVILGACSPEFTYETYVKGRTEVQLLPCHALLYGLADRRVLVEFAPPSCRVPGHEESRWSELERRASCTLSRVVERISFDAST